MKRTANRLLARFALLCIAVIFGAIAVAQANRGLREREDSSQQPAASVAGGEADETPGAVAKLQSPAQLVPIESGPQTAAVPPNPYRESSPEVNQWAPAEAADQVAASPDALPTQYADPLPPPQSNDASDYEMPADSANSSAAAPPSAYEVGAQGYDEPSYTASATEAPAYASPDPYAGASPDPYAERVTAPEFDAEPYQDPPAPAPVAEIAGPQQPAFHAALGEVRSVSEPTRQPDPFGDGQTRDYGEASVQLTDDQLSSDLGNATQGRSLLDGPANPLDEGSGTGNLMAEGTGKPGPVELEGPQTPSLTLEKTAPQEVQVGKPATFTIKIRNNGQTAAHEVLLRDEVPHGTQLIDTTPSSRRTKDGTILWQMGTLNSGAEVTATMQVMPVAEGEIGSVATVSFQASASARSTSTRPQLVVEHSTDREVLVGDDVVFSIKITNPGSGVATNVVVEEDVPAGLRHEAGNELEYEIGTLRPGETRHLELLLKADKPGLVQNLVVARGEGNLIAQDECQLQVVAPQLEVGIRGPARRYLERKATYEVMVANQGTAPARDVELVAYLPRGMKFVNTNNSGHYDSGRHAVFWNLAELPAREMGSVELTALPTEMGELKIRVEGKAQMGLTDNAEQPVVVEGLAALLFTVKDVADPIEVGSQTTYEIKVVNQGSKTATNLLLAAAVPEGMRPISGEGPTQVVIKGQRVFFDPLARLAPQADTTYKIHVEGIHSGDKRFVVEMKSDDVTEPVRKEESTRVYDDE